VRVATIRPLPKVAKMVHMQKILTAVTVALLTVAATGGPAVAQEAPLGVPEGMMLRAEDLDGGAPGPVEEGLAWPLLPQPCAGRSLPRPVAKRSVAADLSTRYRVYEQVARYRGDGARAYLDGLKAQLTDCKVGGNGNGFEPVADDPVGPDTVLFLGQYDEGDRWVCYVAAAVDHYVVMVMLSDKQVGAADPTWTNTIAGRAIARVAANGA
jgi:hypothetical protein